MVRRPWAAAELIREHGRAEVAAVASALLYVGLDPRVGEIHQLGGADRDGAARARQRLGGDRGGLARQRRVVDRREHLARIDVDVPGVGPELAGGVDPAAVHHHHGLRGLDPNVAAGRARPEAAGRDPSQIDVAPQLMVCMDRGGESAVERFRKSRMYIHLQSLASSTLREQNLSRMEQFNLVGTPSELIDRIGALSDAGVTTLAATSFLSETAEIMFEDMQRFAEDVMRHFRQ